MPRESWILNCAVTNGKDYTESVLYNTCRCKDVQSFLMFCLIKQYLTQDIGEKWGCLPGS